MFHTCLGKKMPTAGQQSEEFQQFLDENQYSSNSILRYEKIFGRGFVSTGGLETTQVRLRSLYMYLPEPVILLKVFFFISSLFGMNPSSFNVSGSF